jgi:hypothetical protein
MNFEGTRKETLLKRIEKESNEREREREKELFDPTKT